MSMFWIITSLAIVSTSASIASNSVVVKSNLSSIDPDIIKLATTQPSIVHPTGGDPNWWKYSTIYQIYIRSFVDSNGDGIGDINGIISRLDYIAETGFKAIWLSPIFKSPMVDFGYDVSDYKAIDPVFGTMSDFQELIKQAKERDIKLILGFVPNHTSDKHEWFEQSVLNNSTYKDYYIWSDGRVNMETFERQPPNNWVSAFKGSAWTWNADRGQYYLHQFSSGQPDLNYRNSAVVKEMKDVMRFWLDKGVDGFRVDAVSFLFEDPSFNHEKRTFNPNAQPGDYDSLVHNLTCNRFENYDMVIQWRELLEEYNKKYGSTRVLIVQASGDIPAIVAYYGNSTHSGAHFPFNFNLFKVDNTTTATQFKQIIDDWISHMSEGQWSNWLTGSHDEHRVASRLGHDMVDGMNMISLLLPGTAVTYNGEEIGMEDTFISWKETKDIRGLNAGKKQYFNFSRDPERTPFQWDSSENAGFTNSDKPWLPVNPNYEKLNLRSQMIANKSHYDTYRNLIDARKTQTIQNGTLEVKILSNDIISILREYNGSDPFIVMLNMGTENKTTDLSIFNITGNITVFASSLNSPLKEDDLINKTITLNPKEAVVLTSSNEKITSRTNNANYQKSNGSAHQGLFLLTVILAVITSYIMT